MAKIKNALTFEIEKAKDPLSIWDYREKWLELLNRMQEKNPFLTPHWVFLSYDYFGVKEFFDFYILKHDGKIVGFLPLSVNLKENCVTPVNADLKRAITDIVADPSVKDSIFQFLLNRFEKISFPRVIENSTTLWAMEKVEREKDTLFQKESTDIINKIHLGDNFDRMLYREKGKLKGKAIKLIKKVEREVEVEINVYSGKKDIAFVLDELLALSEEDIFSIGEAAFLRDVTSLFSPLGWAKVYIFKADGWPLAGGLVFSYENSSFLYVLSQRKESFDIKAGDYLFLKILESETGFGTKYFYFFDDGFNPLITTKRLKIEKAVLRKGEIL